MTVLIYLLLLANNDPVIQPTIEGGGTSDVNTLINKIITYFLGFIALAAFVSLLYSAIMFITSGGDTNKAATARKGIIYALIGIAVAILSYFIVGTIGDITSIRWQR